VSTALRQIDASVLEAATELGSTPGTHSGDSPELRPALVRASILTFMASMASFGAVVVRGRKEFITLLIYTTKLNGEIALRPAQSMLLTLVAVGFHRLAGVIRPAGKK
jgi:ABC-type Fe3+ transport system permease subunit